MVGLLRTFPLGTVAGAYWTRALVERWATASPSQHLAAVAEEASWKPGVAVEGDWDWLLAAAAVAGWG